jgi:glycosyltransferase involved in cell wall biosynthesis
MMRKSRPSCSFFYWDSGFGIRRDAAILEKILQTFSYRIRHVRLHNPHSNLERRLLFLKRAWRHPFPMDLQIHFEQVRREHFGLARRNLIFPNPEFFDPDILQKLPNLEAICCKTRYALSLFEPFPFRSVFTGFTAADYLVDAVSKDYRRFLHLAGKSDWKGTDTVLEVWRRHPEWPELTIVWSPLDSYGNPRRRLEGSANIRILNERLPEDELRKLMNRCGIHLCPSLTEGFGHYIVEAMSTRAVVVTTDAPPMNELVDSGHGFLVEAEPVGQQFMSTLYGIRAEDLERRIEEILSTGSEEMVTRGEAARARYLEMDRTFRERMDQLLRSLGL